MNLWYIIILLTIQGLALRCCEGQSSDFFGDKGPWEEDEWDEGSAASEKDDDSGFESGGTIHEEEHDKEHAQQLPKIARTFTTGRFVTSGEGENKGGSTEDDGRYSNSNRNKDHESSSGGFTSGINFAKIGDALDVMRKLKKAKSDQEFANRLKSGPENLGVAFKTFEQLSGLWISVMHRIWRVWKAKGAKVVMHSIVDDLINATGRTIARKADDLLSVAKGIKEEKVNVDFTRNISRKNKTPEKGNVTAKNAPGKSSDYSREKNQGGTFLDTFDAKKKGALDEERTRDEKHYKIRNAHVAQHVSRVTKLSVGNQKPANFGMQRKTKSQRTKNSKGWRSSGSSRSNSQPENARVAATNTHSRSTMESKAETLETLKINFTARENKSHPRPSINHTFPLKDFHMQRKKSLSENEASTKKHINHNNMEISKTGANFTSKRSKQLILRLPNKKVVTNSHQGDTVNRMHEKTYSKSMNTPFNIEKIVFHLNGERRKIAVNETNLGANRYGNKFKANEVDSKIFNDLTWQNNDKKANDSKISGSGETQTGVKTSKQLPDKDKLIKSGVAKKKQSLKTQHVSHNVNRRPLKRLRHFGIKEYIKDRENSSTGREIANANKTMLEKHNHGSNSVGSRMMVNLDFTSGTARGHNGGSDSRQRKDSSKKSGSTRLQTSESKNKHKEHKFSGLNNTMTSDNDTVKEDNSREASSESDKRKDVVKPAPKSFDPEQIDNVTSSTKRRDGKHESLQLSSTQTSKKVRHNMLFKSKRVIDAHAGEARNGDALTSHTHLASLLTTSSDDGVYSIGNVIQDPRKKSSIMRYTNSDDKNTQTFHNLKKSIVKLQNEVIVLETAMADVAKRLGIVERKTEKASPNPVTVRRPLKPYSPYHSSAFASEREATEYFDKDMGTDLPASPHRYNSERIEIPISSLHRDANAPAALLHDEVVDEIPQDITRPGETLHGSKHVSLPLGAGFEDRSENHDILRPIVNIIVPNSKEDVLSPYTTCIPRCQNGGICVDGNICRCPTFFSGRGCERFSVRELLEGSKRRNMLYSTIKIPRVPWSELPNVQELDGTLRPSSRSSALSNNDSDLKQDLGPRDAFVIKKQPLELSSIAMEMPKI
ncbi:uncharacterized protein LOC141896617 isoform X3 [Acropora palmata]|uniref:uncharacterized protein LOC141896617 isoform X3 n=1 Tax=Acropora palmata TaxID=6131 RepID=UPI003DA1B4C6